MILRMVLYVYGTSRLAHGFSMFEYRVLKQILGIKWMEVTGPWSKLHINVFIIILCAKYLRLSNLGRACNTSR